MHIYIINNIEQISHGLHKKRTTNQACLIIAILEVIFSKHSDHSKENSTSPIPLLKFFELLTLYEKI
jgi:hypothetical protein